MHFGHVFLATLNIVVNAYLQENAEQFGNSNAEWAEWKIGDSFLVGKPKGIIDSVRS